MSCIPHVYVGPYVRAISPIIEKESTINSCPKVDCNQHKKTASYGYCYDCGSKVEPIKISLPSNTNFSDLLWALLQDEDLFQIIDMHSTVMEKIVCFVPNKKGQGGVFSRGGSMEYALPDMNFVHPDWNRLTDMLDSLKISYEKKTGILEYWF